MNQRPSQLTRFRVMAAMALAVLAIYLVVLFNRLFTTRNIWPNPFRPSPVWKMWKPPGASSLTAPAGPL